MYSLLVRDQEIKYDYLMNICLKMWQSQIVDLIFAKQWLINWSHSVFQRSFRRNMIFLQQSLSIWLKIIIKILVNMQSIIHHILLQVLLHELWFQKVRKMWRYMIQQLVLELLCLLLRMKLGKIIVQFTRKIFHRSPMNF